MNAVSLALDNLERFGEYPKVYFNGQTHTNAQMLRYARSLATVLADRGVAAGDHVAVMMSNSPQVEAAFQACWMLGAVITPVTPQLSAPEVSYMLKDAGISVVLTSPKLAARVKEAAAEAGAAPVILVFGEVDEHGVTNVEPLVHVAAETTQIAQSGGEDLALLLYTSGTTGHPKGVMLSHENLLFGADAILRKNPEVGRDILLHPLPLSHVYGVLVMNLCNAWGWTTALMPHFETKSAFELIDRHRVTRMSVTPTMLVYMIQFAEREKYDTSSLRIVSSGGAALLDSLRDEFQQVFRCRVHQGYGLSESAAVATGYQEAEQYREGSVGCALPGIEIAIQDGSGKALPPGERGEIALRGQNIMTGYWHKPEATAATLKDGWLLTGDVGYLDADGYLYITDRKKDLIIKGGENISPREIEEAIQSHPSVAEVAVVGYPDAVFGENICAAVVLRAGTALTPDEVREHAGQMVTKFKLPAQVLFLHDLPKSPNGKVLKRSIVVPVPQNVA